MGRSAQLRGRPDLSDFRRNERARKPASDRGGAGAHADRADGRRGGAAQRLRARRGCRRGRGVASPHRSATQHELARVELLAGLPGETLARLGQRMEREEVAPGAILVLEGEPDDRFYVLLAGVLAVSQRDLGARSVLRPGDYFGEVAPAMGILRTATVSAMTPAVVASCDRATFDELLRPLFADDGSASSARTASLETGHASFAQSPNGRSVSTPHATPASGSTQRKVPLAPKCPKVRSELREPVQWGDFASRSSKVSPQSFGSIRPRPGSTPTSPGNWTAVASASVSCATRVGRRSSRPSARRSPSAPR